MLIETMKVIAKVERVCILMAMVYYSNPIRTLVMVRKYEEGGLVIDAGLFFFVVFLVYEHI